MKKIIAIVLAALMLCVSGACSLADSEGTIVQSSCNIVRSGDYYLVYCYAQVHNSSDQIICVDKGEFQLTNGEQLLYSGAVSQLWPYFIGPGEDGYLFDIASFEPNEDGVVVPNVTGIHYNIEYMTIDPAYAGKNLEIEASIEQGGAQDDLSVVCRVSNPHQTDAYGATLAFGLYTGGGSMIYADGQTLKNVGIPADGSVYVRFDIDDLFVQQWLSYGAMPEQVRATAMFRGNTD